MMKLIKTDSRNRLGTDLLTDVMRIKLLAPSIADYNPKEAIHAWNSAGPRSRRPDYQASTSTSIADDTDYDSSSE